MNRITAIARQKRRDAWKRWWAWLVNEAGEWSLWLVLVAAWVVVGIVAWDWVRVAAKNGVN